MEKSYSASYAAAGVDITAGYRAVELMKKHVARTRNEGCLDDVGGFGGCFGLPVAGMEEPVLVSGTDGCGTKVKLAILMDKHDTIGIDAVAMWRKAAVLPGLYCLWQEYSREDRRDCRWCCRGLRAVRCSADWR